MDAFLEDCEKFCTFQSVTSNYKHSFFKEVAVPMAQIYKERKEKVSDGMHIVDDIAATDWRLATRNWLERRVK